MLSYDEYFAQFKRDRDEALLSLDREKIVAYMAKYGEGPPPGQSDDIFWASVHKARTALKDLPLDARLASKKWLDERELRSMDDGELSAAHGG